LLNSEQGRNQYLNEMQSTLPHLTP
jgi:hypothetical protein